MATIKYKQIKNFIKKNELNVFQKYCYNKLDQNINYELDYKNFSPIFNNDCLADSLLDNKLKDIESITNIRLFPTTGMTLPFLSYGGSSIVGISIFSGIILNLTKRKINY